MRYKKNITQNHNLSDHDLDKLRIAFKTLTFQYSKFRTTIRIPQT